MNTLRKNASLALVALAVTALLAVLLWANLPVSEWLQTMVLKIDDLGFLGIVFYFLIYVLLASLSFPTTPLNIGAGVIFGYLVGFATALAGAISAAAATFIFTRHIATEWIKKRLSRSEHFDTMEALVEEQGFKIVFLARINPFIPASFKNFGFAVTGIDQRRYLAGTLLGQIPIVAAHTYIGWTGGLAMMQTESSESPLSGEFMIGGVIASIALLAIISWYANRSLNRRV